MVELIWEFIVREGKKGSFELIFGPGGAWSKLYSSAPGFRRTTVMRDAKNSHRYIVVDVWDSETRMEHVKNENISEYDELMATLDEFTISMKKMGTFNEIGQAMVPPRRRTSVRKP